MEDQAKLLLIEKIRQQAADRIAIETGVPAHVDVHVHDTELDTRALMAAGQELGWRRETIPSEGPGDYDLDLCRAPQASGGLIIYHSPNRSR